MSINRALCYICQKNPKAEGDAICTECKDRRANVGKPTLTPASIHSIWRALTEFGYPVTEEWVKEKAEALLVGASPVGGPDMFMQRWLKDAGLL